jgi:hypothetical protein
MCFLTRCDPSLLFISITVLLKVPVFETRAPPIGISTLLQPPLSLHMSQSCPHPLGSITKYQTGNKVPETEVPIPNPFPSVQVHSSRHGFKSMRLVWIFVSWIHISGTVEAEIFALYTFYVFAMSQGNWRGIHIFSKCIFINVVFFCDWHSTSGFRQSDQRAKHANLRCSQGLLRGRSGRSPVYLGEDVGGVRST